jgi:hypothetical protein
VELSVVIPTLHDTDGARRAAEAIETSCRDLEAEIILADNGCRDDLRDWVRHHARRVAVPIRWVPVRDIGLHNARHAGVRAAQGRILAFIDDDAVVAPTWGRAVVEAFADPELRLLTGPSRPRFAAPPPPWFQSLWSTTDSGIRICPQLSLLDGGEQSGDIDPHLVWGLNFVASAATIHDAGGFHPDAFPWALRRFRGDGELSVTTWVKAHGNRAAYNPDVGVEHAVSLDRLTTNALSRRETLQGISQSYSAFRQADSDRQLEFSAQANPNHEVILRLLHATNRRRTARNRSMPLSLDLGMPIARWRGWRYHRRLLGRSSPLVEWVLRSDYWDAVIPCEAT